MNTEINVSKKYGADLSTVITADNVKRMGEMLAICALRSFHSYSVGANYDKLYRGLVRDAFKPKGACDTFSDGYDFAQAAILFLSGYYGRTLNDIIGNDRRGKPLTVKRACLRYVGREINKKLTNSKRNVCIDNVYGLSVQFEDEVSETDFTSVDETIAVMGLTERQKGALMCRMNGMSYPEAARELSMGTTTVFDIIAKIRVIYIGIFSEPIFRNR